MKRIFLSLVLVLGYTISPISIANASTEGCPDSWKIDTSSSLGFEEIQQAKNRLGSDLAINEPVIQYQNYLGELGSMVAPKDGQQLTIEDIYLFGKTQVLWKIDVQQRNCPNKATFVISRGTLSEYLGFKNVISNVDPQTWAAANESSFVDFTKAAQFGACIKNQQLNFSSQSLPAEPRGNQLVIGALGRLIQQRTFNDPCGLFRINPRRYFVYQDLSLACRYYSESAGRTTVIPKNGSCDISLALPTRDSLIIFPKFTLKAKDYEVAVTCVKGKLTKKLTAYRGYETRVKCPAGYKIKY